MAGSHHPLWLATAIGLTIVLGFPADVAAQGRTAFAWSATAVEAPAGGNKWGFLTLRDGVLTFAMANMEWQTALADIKRVTESSRGDRSMAIETLNGDMLEVSILDRQMLTESPRKAMQIIKRAIREATPVRRMAAAAAASGGASYER